MNLLRAVEIIESDENATMQDELRAWAYVIKSGACWNLQGFYGRGASNLIESGMISKTGRISWKKVNQMMDERN